MIPKRKVEAVLFATSKEISLEDLSKLCSLSLEETKQAVNELIKEYQNKETSLKIAGYGQGWKMAVKDEFIPLVNKIVSETELDKSLMETLAVIAWKYPVLQAEVIKLRHNKAYDHLKQLQELGFISKEKSGRTYKIKLAQKFFDYFDLPTEGTKKAFEKLQTKSEESTKEN